MCVVPRIQKNPSSLAIRRRGGPKRAAPLSPFMKDLMGRPAPDVNVGSNCGGDGQFSGEIDFTTTLGATMKETVSNGEDVFSYLLIEMSSDPSQQYAEQLAKCLGVLLSPSRIRGLL